MRKLSTLLVLLWLLNYSAWAQTRMVSGQITDETGLPVPFASIIIKGTQKGTSADEKGNYQISASAGDILLVSAAGIGDVEVKVGSSSTQTIIVTKSGMLDEVVVTALGVKREKKALGFATQSVAGENLTFSNSVDISAALAGKVAGVKLFGSPSSTFDNASIVIRGPKGFGLTSPLFVLDGTIVSQDIINMDNIEDVSVLKGGAATALYGVRATNGVVMLTSKKGKKGTGTSVEVRSGLAWETLGLIPSYQNEYAGGYSSNANSPGANFSADGWYHFKYNPSIHPAAWAAWDGQKILEYGADESWGPRIDGSSQYRPWYSWYAGGDEFGALTTMTAQPNNVKDFFSTGMNLTNSVSLTSSGNGYNVRLSYNNQNRTLIQPNAKRMLHQVGLSGTFDISKRISFTTDIQYAFDDRNGQPFEGYRNDGKNIMQNFNQWFQRQLDIKQMKDNYYAPDGRVNSWNIGDPNATANLIDITTPQYWDNPWFVANNNYQSSQNQRLSGNIGILVDIAKGLKWNAYVRRYSLNGLSDSRIGTGGLELDYYGLSHTQNSEMNYETNLMYKTKLNQFTIDAMVGMNIRRNTNNGISEGTVGGLSVPNYFNIKASLQTPSYSNTFDRTEVWSHYARATVGYKGFLFLESTLRRDQSSTLPADNNSYVYPSASLSFVFTDLLKYSPVTNWLSFGKVRGGFAQVGEDLSFGTTSTAISAGVPFEGTPYVSYGNTNRDGKIEPALQTSYEVGLELKFLNNKLGLDASYYYNKNEKKILNVSIPGATGYSSIQVNAGEIVNKGVEIALSANLVNKRKFSWDANFNWAWTTNKLIKLTDQLTTYSYGSSGGAVVQHVAGEEWGQLLGRKWTIDPANGLPVISTTGIASFTSNNPIGNILPKWTGGFVNTFRYKLFDLSFNIDYQKGGLMFSLTKYYNVGAGLSDITVGTNDKGYSWRDYPSLGGGVKMVGSDGNGNERIVYIPARRYFYTNLQRETSNYLFDAGYIKVRDIRLGFTFPKQIAESIKAKGIYLSVFVTNPWLIYAESKDFGIDPSELEGTWSESGQLSQTRQVGFNVKFTF